MKIKYLILICAVWSSGQVFAINKCVSPSGKVSFQDKPCSKTSSSEVATVDPVSQSLPENINIVELKMGNVATISVPIPSDWSVELSAPNSQNSSTLKTETKSGESVKLLITTVPLKNSLTKDERNSLLKQIRNQIESQYRGYGSAKEVVSRPIKQAMNNGIGHLYTYIDENLLNAKQLPPGESIYASAGVVIIDNILITTTILTNNVKTDNYGKALAAIHFITN